MAVIRDFEIEFDGEGEYRAYTVEVEVDARDGEVVSVEISGARNGAGEWVEPDEVIDPAEAEAVRERVLDDVTPEMAREIEAEAIERAGWEGC